MKILNRFSIFFIQLFFIFTVSCVSNSTIDTTDLKTDSLINELTLEQKIGQMFVIRPESLSEKKIDGGVKKIDSQMIDFYNDYPAGGFCIFKQNIQTPEQLKELNQQLHSLGYIQPFIFVDEEGGKVARLANDPNFDLPKYESMSEIGESGDVKKAFTAGSTIGAYLKEFNFDVDFAPVADVNSNPNNPVIGTRAFSSDPNVVSRMDLAFLQGLGSKGIEGCLKHFPGHGDTSADTHQGYAESNKTWDQLLKMEMIPFKSGIEKGVSMIMTAHVTLPKVDSSGVPSTLSYIVLTEKLRNELGYNGIIITDAMEMGAITKIYPNDAAVVKAIQAGVDIILMPSNYKKAFNLVLRAVMDGTIPEERIDESVERILKFKKVQ